MIDVFPFHGSPVAVLGLGRSGLSAARALAASGAAVMAWDDDEGRRRRAAEEGLPIVDLADCDWHDVASLVLSPGIPHAYPKPHPVTVAARAGGAEIISDIELLARSQPAADYVGITGTNGKSTTTALIAHLLAAAGRRVQAGGNLGTPALDFDPMERPGAYVIEMSSYQLEITPTIVFDVAVLLNLSPDHLDRHGGMEGYVAAKRMIFDRQTRRQTAVIGVDDDWCRTIFADLTAAGRQRVIPISVTHAVAHGVHVEDGILYDTLDGAPVRMADLRDCPTLPGAHNWQNAAAAYAAVRALGIDGTLAAEAMRRYPGLPHRQALVATIDGVRYINDSKATNADASAKALGCYDRIWWIAGGIPKAGGIESLRAFFPRIRHAYLIGEAAAEFAATLGRDVPHTLAGDLAAAVTAAHADARGPDGVVLLSPACASFDQFTDFEARGRAFADHVAALAGARA